MPSFNFLFGAVSEMQRSKILFLSIWLPHPVTCDVIIIIKTCHMSCRANVENFCLNPTSGCREKHESSVWTNKQTNKHTD